MRIATRPCRASAPSNGGEQCSNPILEAEPQTRALPAGMCNAALSLCCKESVHVALGRVWVWIYRSWVAFAETPVFALTLTTGCNASCVMRTALRRRQAEREAAAAAAVPADEPLLNRLQRLALRAFVKARTDAREDIRGPVYSRGSVWAPL